MSDTAVSSESKPSNAVGLACAIVAYLSWGLLPAYWKQLRHVAPIEVLAHRVVWSAAFLALLLTLLRRWAGVVRAFRDARARRLLLVSTTLVSSNWGLYIWAVNTGHVTESSLGYYVNPILNVLLARVFLGETLRPMQLGALALAVLGVLVLAVGLGALPWIALALALTFSLYGLVRKRAAVDPLSGLAVEVAFAAPIALGFLLTRPMWAASDTAWLVGSGAATSLPLLFFAAGVARLRYSTMGIVQYLSPTCQLALAVLAYGEPFGRVHAITFALIWTAVAVYALDGVLALRRARG